MSRIGDIAGDARRAGGFALTSGYRRTNKLGRPVLYGVVLGFVVYLIEELVSRSGSLASSIPRSGLIAAFAGVVIGRTVLLYREDGRA